MALEDWKRRQIRGHGLLELYHLTSITNLEGVLTNGILPRNAVGRSFGDIAHPDVLERRRGRTVNLGNAGRVGLHDVALLFFTPLTPMLFKVVMDPGRRDALCIITVDPLALCDDRFAIAFGDGNLASGATRSYYTLRRLDEVHWDVIWAPYWTEYDDGVRRRSAEFVVHPGVPVDAITGVVVSSPAARLRAEHAMVDVSCKRPIRVEPSLFFEGDGPRPALEREPLFPRTGDRPRRGDGPPIPPPPGDADAPWA